MGRPVKTSVEKVNPGRTLTEKQEHHLEDTVAKRVPWRSAVDALCPTRSLKGPKGIRRGVKMNLRHTTNRNSGTFKKGSFENFTRLPSSMSRVSSYAVY